jgi:hypothetical protein
MRADVVFPERTQFSLSHPQNFLLIENQGDKVIIRAARDNLSPGAKVCFVRYLAAEGYIPGKYQWLVDNGAQFNSGLSWLFDDSWIAVPSGSAHRPLRQVIHVIFYASLIWLALMSFAFLHSQH